MDNILEDLIESVNELKSNYVSNFYTYKKFGQFSKQINDMVTNVSELMEDNYVMKKKMIEQDEKILQLENFIFAGQSLPGQEILRETMDKQFESRGIILFDLPEYEKKYEHILKNLFSTTKSKATNFSFSCLDNLSSSRVYNRQSFEIQSLIRQSNEFNQLKSQKQLYSSSKWTDIRLAFDRTMETLWGHTSDFQKKKQGRRENGEKHT